MCLSGSVVKGSGEVIVLPNSRGNLSICLTLKLVTHLWSEGILSMCHKNPRVYIGLFVD